MHSSCKLLILQLSHLALKQGQRLYSSKLFFFLSYYAFDAFEKEKKTLCRKLVLPWKEQNTLCRRERLSNTIEIDNVSNRYILKSSGSEIVIDRSERKSLEPWWGDKKQEQG